MIDRKKIIFLLVPILLFNCSFDNKTGLWKGEEKERKRISELEKRQKQIITIDKVYTSDNIYTKEVSLKKKIILSNPKKVISWEISGLNNQNFLGNIYSSGIDYIFFKKKIGKDKFSISKNKTSLLFHKNNIIFSDDTGTIFSLYETGKINWKKNIYKKIYKKVYKNLTFSIYKNIIYVADNIGFVYAIDSSSGKLVWIKNHGTPIKSDVKIYENKVFLIDHDNRIFSLNTKDGTKVWQILSISSFIKSQSLLSLAVTKTGDLIAINSSADLFKINCEKGNIYWSSNTSDTLFANETDFFKSSNVVIDNDQIIFSAGSSMFSYNIINGIKNWEKEVTSIATPIIDRENIFIVTDNGYFVILEKNTGQIINSTNILKVLKKKRRNTKITNFIMGSGKIYAMTLNGFLIVSSATSGNVVSFKKIGDTVSSSPVINNGNLYILTEGSKIIGFQ
tara:strand:+ start:3985 stop:5334 length:1350 start_codon:yes stop_codon:yes gene_type:complete